MFMCLCDVYVSVCVCRLLIVIGLLWIVYSLINSVIRAYVLNLLAADTTIDLIDLFNLGNK